VGCSEARKIGSPLSSNVPAAGRWQTKVVNQRAMKPMVFESETGMNIERSDVRRRCLICIDEDDFE
jgi:hypothetical protein